MVILIGAASFALISLISLEYMELPEQRLFIFLAGHDVIYGILSSECPGKAKLSR
jgi:hypothetical protein